ncbi:tyrosine--tRNA ligase [Portibacter lacus]|uniref:Tyrosine--tRNA ligase n=1 Tax=Portibacter lacus TaxID=1099794 RepID=A0AA37SM69_9BACT|nr:tyrosine--tRNA ligase [Portibacter lacus]GLR16465.1 tyrosine--tRNA ligase [Portibacter lacus]
MNFIDELRWRGMLHNMTPEVEKLLSEQKVVGYIGFDPTAPSMTIGNYVQIMLLTLFQKHGHTPIVLMGGATGRIGDPSGKSEERQLKTYEELDRNLSFQVKQMEKFLDFQEKENHAILRNNLDFYKEMNVLDFLRDVGKNLTVNYMMSKDSVKNRLEHGLSFTEFSYQLLQANDFLYLFRNDNCVVQMGGSDQWGNITSGTEFIRRNTTDGKAHAVTTPLLTKADGSKFGKSTEGNIWLDPELTSPYTFYQFWLNASNDDIGKYMRYFTFKSKEEVEEIEAKYADQPNEITRILAEELTRRVHSDEDYEAVLNVSELLFNKKVGEEYVQNLNLKSLQSIAKEIPSYQVSQQEIDKGITLDELLTEKASIFSSKSELRRAVKANAVAINKKKAESFDALITGEDALHAKYILGENGKKKQFIIEIV